MDDAADLVAFYEGAYAEPDPALGQRYARWRALGAVGKADHVLDLCSGAGVAPATTLDVGCGDGALLAELGRRGFGGKLYGVELSEAAAAIARARPEIEAVDTYDGLRLPAADGAHDLGIVCHVLEHVPDPGALVAEVGRVCSSVLIEVPLEANLSAARSAKRRHSQQIGHLQRFSRAAVRSLVAGAGLVVVCEQSDPLALEVHRFFAQTPLARAAATVRWAMRGALHGLAPAAARRVFTVHYACLCQPASGPGTASAGAPRHTGGDHAQP